LTERQVPAYLTMAEVAACSGGWTTRYTRGFLRRGGVAELVGGEWVVAESALRERFPDLYARVFRKYVLDDQVLQGV